MRLAALITGLAALIAALLWLFPPAAPHAALAAHAPWQIDHLADGSTRVFTLSPGHSTLAEALAVFGSDAQLAVIESAQQEPALEAFYERINLGELTGTLVLRSALAPEAVAALRAHARSGDTLENGARRSAPATADLPAALAAPMQGIVFAPSARLDAAIIRTRFGAATEVLVTPEGISHHLYPADGLDIALAANGKALLQYVAPVRFDRLRAPLVAAGARAAPGGETPQ